MRRRPQPCLGHRGRRRLESRTRKMKAELIAETAFSIFTGTVIYPKENPAGAISTITKTLRHLGVFEGIDRN